MRISAKGLAKQRTRVAAGYERAKSRKDETAANRIELRLRDLTRAQNELGENLSQWSFDPGKPVLNTDVTNQLLSQIETMVIDARKNSVQPLDRSQILLHRFDRMPGAETYRIEIALAGESTGYWLNLRGSPTPFSCYLMPGAGESTRYLIELDSGGPDETGALRLFTGDGLGYLTERIDSTLRFRTLDDDEREQLEQLQRAVRQVLTSYRSGGLFCVFTRSIDQVDPLLSHLAWNR